MAKRYEVIKHVQQEYWFDNAPLLLSAHALIKDTVSDAVCAQCKFTNLSQMEIGAVYISIACIGADGNSVEGVEQYVYLDLKTRASEFLGDDKLIPLPDKTTRQFTVALDKVVFSDGSAWQTDGRKYFASLPAPIPLSKLARLEEQYRRIAPEELQANLPERHDTYWRCGCGQTNLAQTEKCINCGYDLKSQLAAIDTDTLETQLAEYVARQKEQKRLDTEQRDAAIQRENQERQVAKLKRQKIIKVTLSVLSVVIIAGISYNLWLNSNMHKYNIAISMFKSESYDEAKNAFLRLGDYKDSADKVTEIIGIQNSGPYNDAVALFNIGEYDKAIEAFVRLGDYKDSTDRLAEAIEAKNNETYNNAIAWLNADEYGKAAIAFGKLDNYKDSIVFFEKSKKAWMLANRNFTISASDYHTVGVKSDGRAVAAGISENGECFVSGWSDIVSVSAGDGYTIGLKNDGTVVSSGGGMFTKYYGQCNVSDWTDIVAVSASAKHTVGLKADGTVVAVGNNESGQCDVANWSDIVAVSAGGTHTVGLKSDGTVVAVGNRKYGICQVSDWTDIVAISTSGWHTFGLKSDGTVVIVGADEKAEVIGYKMKPLFSVTEWSDIIAVSAESYFIVGLKSDGTVIAVGDNGDGQGNISNWTDIIAISAGNSHTIGLKADGTVVVTGKNSFKQCNVTDWTDIRTKPVIITEFKKENVDNEISLSGSEEISDKVVAEISSQSQEKEDLTSFQNSEVSALEKVKPILSAEYLSGLWRDPDADSRIYISFTNNAYEYSWMQWFDDQNNLVDKQHIDKGTYTISGNTLYLTSTVFDQAVYPYIQVKIIDQNYCEMTEPRTDYAKTTLHKKYK